MEEKSLVTSRTRWFNEARFGIFIHWGIYSIPARGEWVMHVERIPAREYARFAEEFNPDRFNADEWVSLAKEAGMKYMVLTTRHHDGYSLFDSKVSDFTSVKTKAKRDFVAEYVQACRRAGMRIGFYYSLLDWRWPAYFNGPLKDPEDWAKLVQYAHNQVKELCTQYSKIDILWYDGEWIPEIRHNRTLIEQGKSPEIGRCWRSKELNTMVRKLQPHTIINNRSGLPEDFDTPEQHISPSETGRLWESCMTINDNWGYSAGDHNWKTTRQLIHNLVRCASGGGNFLLNVGPKPNGTIPEPPVERLKEIGKWMKVNGEAIYGTGQAPFGGGMVGLTTAKDSIVYLHVLRWVGEEICIAGVKDKVNEAYILVTGKKVNVIQKGERLFLRNLPQKAPDDYDSVIVLKLEE